MPTEWSRVTDWVFETREQAVSKAETLRKESTFRVLQIDNYPPAYVIEMKVPEGNRYNERDGDEWE